jgi:hypothetical protein
MAITRTAMIDDDGTGTTGTILNNAWKTELYNQIDAASGATPVHVPFNAANFAASGGGSWTAVSQATLTYVVLNQRTMLLEWYFDGGTIAGAPVWLYLTIPGILPWVKKVGNPFHYWGGTGITGTGVALAQPTETRIGLLRDIGGTPWANGAMTIAGQLTIPI